MNSVQNNVQKCAKNWWYSIFWSKSAMTMWQSLCFPSSIHRVNNNLVCCEVSYNLWRFFPEFSKVVYYSLLLGTFQDCAACPKPHRLVLPVGGTVGNWTPSQIPNSLSYPATCSWGYSTRSKKKLCDLNQGKGRPKLISICRLSCWYQKRKQMTAEPPNKDPNLPWTFQILRC